MRISLIAMDLDGTTLQADGNRFSPRLQAALARAHERGVAVVPVTGRQYAFLPEAVQTGAAWENLCVLCNGGQIRRLATGELLENWPLPSAALPLLIDVAEALELPLEFSVGGKVYLTPADWERERQWREGDLSFHLNTILVQQGHAVPDLRALCGEETEKVLFPCVPEGKKGELERRMAELPVSGVWSGTNSMELSHPLATKASGLRSVCRRLGIPLEETMAMGDNGNDVTMLQAAGLGVAVANAPPEVQQAADAVTASSEEDGAALAIERFVLSGGETGKGAAP